MNSIYVLGVKTGTSSYGILSDASIEGDIAGYAFKDVLEVNEDGKEKPTVIAFHFSSGEVWCKHDMGVTSDCKHNIYEKEYPEGYKLIWLGIYENMKAALEEIEKIIAK